MNHRKPVRVHYSGQALALTTTLLLGAGAQAQDLDIDGLRALDDDRDDVRYQDVTLSRLEDMQVSRDGRVIGEVEEILGDASGEPVALVIELEDELEDALLDGRDHEFVIALDQVEMDVEGRRVEVSLDDQALIALPRWQD